MPATNIPFVIDLEQTTGIELGSLERFKQSVQAFPGFTGTNPTKKAILILQKYITSLSNFGSVSDERQAFFSSNQFLETFTTQLNKLNSSIAPLTFEQFQSESKDESKSAISIFLDTIFLKSYDKQSHSWRTALAKYLKSSGTLCTTLQPIREVRVVNTDSLNPAELSDYQSALQPALGAVARQNAVPSQLINYSFSGGAIGFTKRATCYLCGLPIGAKTANTSTKKKNKDESRALDGVGNTNCEHVMPFLSALQSWDFISKALDNPSITKKFEMSDEFAWSHFCCNMLKQNIDFLHLDNNGLYVPHYHNIETYLNWLSSNDNRGKYDCLHVLGGFNRDNARTSIMERVDRLCDVLNRDNTPVPNKKNKNNYSDSQLTKVYGIFLLLQYVTVADFSNIIKTKTRIGIGFFGGAQRSDGPQRSDDPKLFERNLGNVKDIRDSRVKMAVELRKQAQIGRMHKFRLSSEQSEDSPRSPTAMNYAAAPPLQQPPPYPTPPHSTQPPLLSQAEYLKLFEIIKSAFYQTINGLDEASINWITSIIERAAANIETGINLLDYGEFKTTVFTPIWGQVARIGIMEQIITVATAMDGRNIRTIPLPQGITIVGMCEKWFSNMIYDYFNIKLTVTDKRQILTKLQEEQSIATTDPARLAITDAEVKITNEISNLTLMISPTSEKDGQLTTMTNALTTLQAMIKNANEVIFIPMLTSLTANMTPVVTNISVIENIDDIIFYLEQFVTFLNYDTEAKTALQAAAAAAEAFAAAAGPEKEAASAAVKGAAKYVEHLADNLRITHTQIQQLIPLVMPILSTNLGSIRQDATRQSGNIPFISQALSALPRIDQSQHAPGFEEVAANITGLDGFISNLSETINAKWATFHAEWTSFHTILAALSEEAKQKKMEEIQTKMKEIEGKLEEIGDDEQNRDALIKLKELIVGRQNLETLSNNLTTFGRSATTDIESIKSFLILPLKIVKTYLTDANTANVKNAVDTAFTQGGGNRNHKRKSCGYRKTIRRNNKRIIRVAKGGAATYRKKHNKSRKHKTIKHKTRKHKTRRHKRL